MISSKKMVSAVHESIRLKCQIKVAPRTFEEETGERVLVIMIKAPVNESVAILPKLIIDSWNECASIDCQIKPM